MDPQQDDPAGREKLIRAMTAIKAIVAENGMAASITLALPSQFELALIVDAPWSCIRIESDGDGEFMRLRSKLDEYGGDVARQKAHLEATLGMAAAFGEMLATHAMALLDVHKQAGKVLDVEHTALTKVEKH
jgi:hypothetical protein